MEEEREKMRQDIRDKVSDLEPSLAFPSFQLLWRYEPPSAPLYFLLQFKLTLVGSPFYERLPNGVRLNYKGPEQQRRDI